MADDPPTGASRNQGLEINMFTLDNTSGFTQADCDVMNKAVAVLMERGIDESNACDMVNNNWQETGNTVESLTARPI